MTEGAPKESSEKRKPNQLIKEKSPYLLQHAYNPVDWWPWGEEALSRARRENKPIFLSIGYSACHWCHVMERESFEDEEIAKLLNENFVCIKVDREERPDLDEVYMKSVIAMTGSGGWPLNVFLTPKLEPFFGGTYFPPVSRDGMLGFSSILKSVIKAWRSDRQNIVKSASKMREALTQMYEIESTSMKRGGQQGELEFDTGILDETFVALSSIYDEQHGGLGGAPKFPSPSNLFFLLRYYNRTGHKFALSMAVKTLEKMARGGIYDQIGGGFHRYSTDRFWIVPHFEKMLYDNALLSIAYTEAYLVTGNPLFRRVVMETLEWVIREMRLHPRDKEGKLTAGGFFSSQDADSPNGDEGAFYVWDKQEILDALKNSSDYELLAQIALSYFSVTEEGNFERRKTVLTAEKELSFIAMQIGLETKRVEEILSQVKSLLFAARSKRDKPQIDDKIITSWNGLMISAMSKAYSAFGDDRFLKAAIDSADFVLSNLVKSESGGRLTVLRSYRDGESRGPGTLEDYAFLANGLLDLYEACFESKYLKISISICDEMISRFFDSKSGGFFLVEEGAKDLIARPKEAYDGATPSGNSVASLVLLKLAELTGREDFKLKAKSVFVAFSSRIRSQPYSLTHMLLAFDFYTSPKREIVISGNLKEDNMREMLDLLRKEFLPNSVLALAEKETEDLALPIVKGRLPQRDGESKIYVCTNNTCKLPAANRDDLLKALRS